jgi:hypothetical protein
MADDFGVRTKPRRPPYGMIAVVGFIVLAVGITVGTRLKQKPEAIDNARKWTFNGPPCPPMTKEAFKATGVALTRSFQYGEVRFARQFGHSSCNNVATKGGRGLGTFEVCQFTSPAILQVTTRKSDTYYAPGAGQPAIVSMEGGQPRCILGSDQKLR